MRGLRLPLAKLNFFRRGTIAGDTFVLGGSQALGYLLPLAATPILIHRVGMTAYGLFALVQILGLFTQAIVDYGFSFTATRSVVNARHDAKERNAIFVNVTAVKVGLYIACMALVSVALVAAPWSKYALVFEAFFPYSILTLSSLLVPLWYFQGLGDVQRAALFTGLARISSLVALLAFVSPESSLVSIGWLYSLPGLLVAGIFWATSLPERPDWQQIQWRRMKVLLDEGRHVFATNVLSIGLTNSGPFIISTVSTPTVVGLYAVAERVAKTMSYIYGPLTQVIYPRVVAAFQGGHEKGVHFIKRVMVLYIGSGVVMGAVAFFGAGYIMTLLGANDSKSAVVLRWLAMWIVVSVANNVTGLQLLTALGMSRYYMRCFFASALIYLVCAFLFTSEFSAIGPAVALMIGEMCLFIMILTKARKLLAHDYARSN